jgi:hypothetical protein
MSYTRNDIIHLKYHPGGNYYGLGAAPSAAFTANLNKLNYITSTADSLTPDVASEYQGKFSKFNQKLAAISGTIAGAAAIVPPFGETVAVVLGVVAGVASIMAKVFKNSKAKKTAAEKAQYTQAIIDLRNDNDAIDDYIEDLTHKISVLKAQIDSGGKSVQGLGKICIIGCKAKAQKAVVTDAKASYERLQQDQQDKVGYVNTLLDEYKSQIDRVAVIKDSGDLTKILGWALGGLAVAAVGLVIYVKVKKNKKQDHALNK